MNQATATYARGLVWGLLWGIVLRLLCPAGAAPGDFREFDPRYRERQWTSDDTLPHNRIRCLLQSQDGYLWIGTAAGLVRFDGLQPTLFVTVHG